MLYSSSSPAAICLSPISNILSFTIVSSFTNIYIFTSAIRTGVHVVKIRAFVTRDPPSWRGKETESEILSLTSKVIIRCIFLWHILCIMSNLVVNLWPPTVRSVFSDGTDKPNLNNFQWAASPPNPNFPHNLGVFRAWFCHSQPPQIVRDCCNSIRQVMGSNLNRSFVVFCSFSRLLEYTTNIPPYCLHTHK